MFENTKVVLVGLGRIGFSYDYDFQNRILKSEQVMSHCKAIDKFYNFAEVLVVDPDKKRQKLVTEVYKFKSISNLNDSTFEVQPKLLVIATPTPSHKEVFESLCKRFGEASYLIEKPVGRNLRECREIGAIADFYNAKVFVNYFRRYLPATLNAKNFIKKLNLGRMMSMTINAYGSLNNIFSHFVDLSIELAGPQSFCGCQKRIMEISNSRIIGKCDKCAQTLSFMNVGNEMQPCSVLLDFENYIISISDSGKFIEIANRINQQSRIFVNTSEDYLNYQSFVYSKILETPNISRQYVGLDQASKVHQILESVQFVDAKL